MVMLRRICHKLFIQSSDVSQIVTFEDRGVNAVMDCNSTDPCKRARQQKQKGFPNDAVVGSLIPSKQDEGIPCGLKGKCTEIGVDLQCKDHLSEAWNCEILPRRVEGHARRGPISHDR